MIRGVRRLCRPLLSWLSVSLESPCTVLRPLLSWLSVSWPVGSSLRRAPIHDEGKRVKESGEPSPCRWEQISRGTGPGRPPYHSDGIGPRGRVRSKKDVWWDCAHLRSSSEIYLFIHLSTYILFSRFFRQLFALSRFHH